MNFGTPRRQAGVGQQTVKGQCRGVAMQHGAGHGHVFQSPAALLHTSIALLPPAAANPGMQVPLEVAAVGRMLGCLYGGQSST